MRHLPVLSLLGLGVLATGCSWYAPQAALNPKYKVAGSAPGPARVLPILECLHTDKGDKNARQHELFLAAMPNEIWKAAGMNGQPVLSSVPYSNPLCEEFYREDNERQKGYTMNARVQRAVDQALEGRPEQSLLVTTYFFPYRCEERKGSVNDEQGRALGTVGTGQVDCWESGGVQMTTLLLTRTEIVWQSQTFQGEDYNNNYAGTYEDSPKIAAQLFGNGFPHNVVAATTVVETTPAAEPANAPPVKAPPTKTKPPTKSKPAHPRQARTRAPSTRNS
ncbi:MAG TPA: hypothetical protein VGM90_24770 [Kofleriaceae bacterium]|jgi:hypothetical protein